MKLLIAQLGACGVLCYFAYHALVGEQGLAEWTRLQKREQELIVEIRVLEREKNRIATQIQRLHADNLDLDLVEELSREKLAFARRDEWIIYKDSLR